MLAPALVAGDAGAQSEAGFVPVTDEMLQDPAPGDWLIWRRTLDGRGYSPLDQGQSRQRRRTTDMESP